MQEGEGCPIPRLCALQSGVPIIGMGLLLVVVGAMGALLPETFPIGTVPALIFAGFGIFLVWLGITK